MIILLKATLNTAHVGTFKNVIDENKFSVCNIHGCSILEKEEATKEYDLLEYFQVGSCSEENLEKWRNSEKFTIDLAKTSDDCNILLERMCNDEDWRIVQGIIISTDN